eukprot:6175241-Pleurochrysis_carterae.AAC.2
MQSDYADKRGEHERAVGDEHADGGVGGGRWRPGRPKAGGGGNAAVEAELGSGNTSCGGHRVRAASEHGLAAVFYPPGDRALDADAEDVLFKYERARCHCLPRELPARVAARLARHAGVASCKDFEQGRDEARGPHANGCGRDGGAAHATRPSLGVHAWGRSCTSPRMSHVRAQC